MHTHAPAQTCKHASKQESSLFLSLLHVHDIEWSERDLLWLPCHQGKKFTPSSCFANALLKSIISPLTSTYSLYHPSNHLSYWISVHPLHCLLFIKNSLCARHWGGKILTVSVIWTQALRLPIKKAQRELETQSSAELGQRGRESSGSWASVHVA